jgi:hypothetical protein
MERLSRKKLTEKVRSLETETYQLKNIMFPLLELNYADKYYMYKAFNYFKRSTETVFLHITHICDMKPTCEKISITYDGIKPEMIIKCSYLENDTTNSFTTLSNADKISKKTFDKMLKIALEYKHNVKF